MKKYTILDCINYANAKMGKCLSEEYINYSSKLHWICVQGHEFYAPLKTVIKGHWCPECAGVKKLTESFVKSEIKKRKGKLLNNYISSGKYILIRCLKDNYEWKTTWDNIKGGHWCPKCANQPRITPKDLKELVEKKDGYLVDSTSFKSAKSKIKVKCLKDNYEWETTWDYLKQGNWCPKCAGKILKTYDELNRLIISRNGIIMEGPKKFNHLTKFKIKCMKDNYEWVASYYSLVYQKTWCPKCAGNVMKSYAEVKQLVESKNGVLVSDSKSLVKNTSKLKIMCNEGHEWIVSYANLVNNKRWCPYCKSNSEQKKLYDIICEIFGEDCIYNFRGLDWLKDKRNMEIDIWVPTIKLAIEYDGPHHYMPIKYNMGYDFAINKYKETVRRDKLKNELISEHKDQVKYFIRFNFRERIDKNFVVKKLENNNIGK